MRLPPQQDRQEPQAQLPPDVCSNEAWHEALGQVRAQLSRWAPELRGVRLKRQRAQMQLMELQRQQAQMVQKLQWQVLSQRPLGQMQTQVPSQAPAADEEASRRLHKRGRQGKRTEL